MQLAERLAAYVLPPYGMVGIPQADAEVTLMDEEAGNMLVPMNRTKRSTDELNVIETI